MLVEPVREPLEPLGLARVHALVAVRVVAHQHLGEVRVELLDVGAEVVAVLEVELVLARLLDRHREQQAALLRLLGHALGGAELLVDEAAGGVRVHALLGRLEEPLEDQMLRVGDLLGLLGGRVALDSEHLLLERAAVIEREDVELSVVAEGHTWVIPSAPYGARFHGPRLHARDRGGAHDRGRGDARSLQLDRAPAGRSERRADRWRGEAGADGGRLRDRHDAREEHGRGGSAAALAAADGQPGGPASTGSRSARPARTRSRSGRTSGSWRARATAT